VAQLATQTVEGRRAREKAKMAALESAELRRRQALQAALRATPPRCAPTAAAQQQRFVEGWTQQQQQQQQQQEEAATFDEDGSAKNSRAAPEGDHDTASLLVGNRPRSVCRRSCGGSRSSSSRAAAAVQVKERGDDKQRKLCYIRSHIEVQSLNEVEHSFRVRGSLDYFWVEEAGYAGRIKEKYDIDVPLGSVADGVYQGVVTLPDDGSSTIPINPSHLFIGQLELSETSSPRLLFDDVHGIVHYTVFFDATIKAIFDLHYFPFDRQVLPVQLQFRSSCFRLSPQPFAGVPDNKDWDLRIPFVVELATAFADKYTFCTKSTESPCLYDCSTWKPTIKILCQRVSTPWIYGFMLPTFLIVMNAGSILFMPAEDIGNRVATLLALMLTLVALKFSMADKLPVVPYLTKLDVELLLGIMLLCFVVLGVCISSLISMRSRPGKDDPPWTEFDIWMLGFAATLWVGLHTYLLRLTVNRPSWEEVISWRLERPRQKHKCRELVDIERNVVSHGRYKHS
jgi:hypothetical protein